jgi:hypothetical protein
MYNNKTYNNYQVKYNIEEIKEKLLCEKEFDKNDINVFIKYLTELKKDSKNQVNNYLSNDIAIYFLKQVVKDGLVIDGKHILFMVRYGKLSVEFDYIAYKNLLLKKYPESIIDYDVVYKDDDFSFEKKDGKIFHTHIKNSIFKKEEIKGAYCIIKNKRGHFSSILNKEDIDKIQNISKGSNCWKNWYEKMVFKTVLRDCIKKLSSDEFGNIETLDNENYDLERPVNVSVEHTEAFKKINDIDELKKYIEENEDKVKNTNAFKAMGRIRFKEIRLEEDNNFQELLNLKVSDENKKQEILTEYRTANLVKKKEIREKVASY